MMKKILQNGACRDLLILLLIGLVIGIYLIASTVIISKDGVFYIERAQRIKEDPMTALSQRPSGYELMILVAHGAYEKITGDTSVHGWIIAGQSTTLLCKLLAIAGLYLAGSLLVGKRYSFWACFILLFLPEPIHLGVDILREWPNLCFMSFAFFLILYGFKKRHVWAFCLFGFLGGLSFYIRPESFLLIIITSVLLVFFGIKSTRYYSRAGALAGLGLLILGFVGPFLAYAGYSGKLNTRYLESYQTRASSAFQNFFAESSDMPIVNKSKTSRNRSLSIFFYELHKEGGELLMWFFSPFLAIGLYCRLRKTADPFERFFVITFALMTCVLLLFRYWYAQPTVSGRWVLPLICLTAFYIPIGIKESVDWAANKNSRTTENSEKWFLVITTAGILLCLPKLLKPLGFEKREYRQAACWLEENTRPNELIYTFDRRIPFYAERKYILYDANNISKPNFKTDSLIVMSKKVKAEMPQPRGLKLQRSFPMKSGKKEMLIFRYEP